MQRSWKILMREFHIDSGSASTEMPGSSRKNPTSDYVITENPGEPELVRKIRVACFNTSKRFPPAGEIASD
jgi:hypothetical protein